MNSSPEDLRRLRADLAAATGHDAKLDRAVSRALDGGSGDDYSASVTRCTELIAHRLPGWRWHVGYGAAGVFPYATLSRNEIVLTASAPTVPLALLIAFVDAILWTTRDDAALGRV